MKLRLGSLAVWGLILSVSFLSKEALSQTTKQALDELRQIGTGEIAAAKAAVLASKLKSANDLSLTETLQAMKGASPIGRNWLAGLANSQYRKQKGKASADLQKILNDKSQDGEARYKAFVWLTGESPSLKSTLLPTMLDDPSPELRYAAIESALSTAKEKSQLQILLDAARHPEQVVDLIKKLEELKVEVDQSKHFGFITNWNLIGPFDHVGSKNFGTSFPVEKDWVSGSIAASYDGKKEKVNWKEFTSKEKDGNIDLAAIFSNEKGCIVYAETSFNSPIEGPAEIRLGCINGHKIWLNGQLVMSNEVYHSSSQIDQYIEPIVLKKGPNKILIKICQNEQTEPWAQRFQFQVRISDSTGKAIQQ